MYRQIQPHPILQKYVTFFWISETDDYFQYFSPASTFTDLVFFCQGTMQNTQNHQNLSQNGVVFGQKTSFSNYQTLHSKAKLFGIRVRPSIFLLTLKIPAFQLNEQSISLGQLFGNEGDRLTDNIINAPTIEESIALFSSFIIQKIKELPAKYQLIEKIVHSDAIFRDFSAKNLALSERQFERNFKDYTGFSLRKYTKIKRFEQVYNALRSAQNIDNLTQFALQYDYYDQAHFNRDFKEFTNLSPLQLFQKK